MGSRNIYDPDDLEGLVDLWLSDVGGPYAGRRYNGFVLLNDEREILDMFVTDVEDEAIDGDDEANGYDIIVDRIQQTPGTTNVICMHGHTTDVPDGPCPGMLEFAGSLVIELATRAKVTFRFIVVLKGTTLDGVLTAQLPEPVMEMLLDGDVIGAREMADQLAGFDLSEPPQEMAQRIIETGLDDNPILTNLLRKIRSGETPSQDELIEGIEEISRVGPPGIASTAANIAGEARRSMKNINPLELPLMQLPRGDLLN